MLYRNEQFRGAWLLATLLLFVSACVQGTVPEDGSNDGSNNGGTDTVEADDAGLDTTTEDTTTQDTGGDAGADVEQDTGPVCPNEPCAQGESTCTSDGRVQGCVRATNGCLIWSNPASCGGGSTCENGACTGCVDGDGDGYGENCGTGADCDDTDPDVYALAPELCDGVDNNCNGETDEVYSQLDGSCTVTQNGCTGSGTWVCNSTEDGVECDGTVNTSAEVCDGVDNDCDGSVDEDFSQLGQSCTVNQNGCTGPGTYVCNGSGSGVECSGSVSTSPETCDGVDNDCDGSVDEDYSNLGDSCQSGSGACAVSGQIVCDPNDEWSTTCNAGSSNTQNATRETCDGIDNDCDGSIDENACFACVEDTYEENDSSLAGTDLTYSRTVSDVTACGEVGVDLDRDWFRMGTNAAGATVELTWPTGTNAVGASYPDLRIDIFCGSSYCGNISGSNGSLSGTIPSCGTCNYAFYVYNSGNNPPSGTPYNVTRR